MLDFCGAVDIDRNIKIQHYGTYYQGNKGHS